MISMIMQIMYTARSHWFPLAASCAWTKLMKYSKDLVNSLDALYYYLIYNLQGYQSTVRQASYTAHEFENEVITKDNIDEMIYARRVKDNKTLTQVLIAASVVCFWWPFSLVCLAAAYYTSEKVHTSNTLVQRYYFICYVSLGQLL